jgi:hypothetical protein
MTSPLDVEALALKWLEYEPGEADDIVASLAALIQSAVEAEREAYTSAVIKRVAELVRLPSSRLLYSKDGVDCIYDDVRRDDVVAIAMQLKDDVDAIRARGTR